MAGRRSMASSSYDQRKVPDFCSPRPPSVDDHDRMVRAAHRAKDPRRGNFKIQEDSSSSFKLQVGSLTLSATAYILPRPPKPTPTTPSSASCAPTPCPAHVPLRAKFPWTGVQLVLVQRPRMGGCSTSALCDVARCLCAISSPEQEGVLEGNDSAVRDARRTKRPADAPGILQVAPTQSQDLTYKRELNSFREDLKTGASGKRLYRIQTRPGPESNGASLHASAAKVEPPTIVWAKRNAPFEEVA
ncbi:hypothetical protein B0H16DRAFT_1467820 [Mycena metata]|uniref:Uncharacterized protein n=1 Tax=Mycena metata TaxID=1033252 RepID=A0AAD7I4E8_9AGAR|nr:hypothetical protein B0H16DRAFT_1467820 [Mycena metata]